MGDATAREHGVTLLDGAAVRSLRHPGSDPFWAAFGRWSAEAASAHER